MCGIVGYISNNDQLYKGAKNHFMRYALALDTLRGEDSTGLITLSRRFKVKTLKTTMAGDRFVHSKDYAKKVNTGWAQVGHNRAATRGGVNVENAHPFTFGDVTMVHNGTLYAGGKSLDTFDKSIGDVDSMQIAYALSKYPPEKAGEVLSQIDGSFALVWTDRRDESVNMVRNAERPLHFTFNKAKTVLWYMSDGHHLHSINKSFGQHDCKGQSIFEMDKHKILKYRKGVKAPEVIRFTPFVQPVGNKWTGNNKTHGKSTGTSKKSTTKTTQQSNQGKPGEALRKATDEWKKGLGSADSTSPSTDGKLSSVQVEVQGRKRRIPSPMQLALLNEMYLTPDDMIQFQPEDAAMLANGRYVVYGQMLHPVLNYEPWDMTLHNITKLQYNAYKDQDWLVRPIGLCAPHKYDRKNSGVLGAVVHCSWDTYQENRKNRENNREPSDDKEGDSTRIITTEGLEKGHIDTPLSGDILVPGPNGRMMPWRRLRNMLDAGCIECGMELMETYVDRYQEVNEGRDLLCTACQIDLQNERNSLPTIN